jgi:hypothetical protein
MKSLLLGALLLIAVADTVTGTQDGKYAGVLPWTVTDPTPFPWEGLTDDLDALLKVQVGH